MPKRQTDEPSVLLDYASEETMTPRDVARHQKTSYKTILTRIKERKLKAYRNTAGKLLILKSDYNDFFAGHKLKHSHLAFGLDSFFGDDLDPAYEPPEEADIDSLSEEELLDAYVIPSEWLDVPQAKPERMLTAKEINDRKLAEEQTEKDKDAFYQAMKDWKP